MYHKTLKKLEKILDSHSIVNERDAILNELLDVVNEVYDEAYDEGRCDGMGDYGEQDDEDWEED